MRDTVIDNSGNQIYLTDERWQHIIENHEEMHGLRDRALDVLKSGHHKQDPLDPSKSKYSKRYDDLSVTDVPNNFVLTAYQVYTYSS